MNFDLVGWTPQILLPSLHDFLDQKRCVRSDLIPFAPFFIFSSTFIIFSPLAVHSRLALSQLYSNGMLHCHYRFILYFIPSLNTELQPFSLVSFAPSVRRPEFLSLDNSADRAIKLAGAIFQSLSIPWNDGVLWASCCRLNLSWNLTTSVSVSHFLLLSLYFVSQCLCSASPGCLDSDQLLYLLLPSTTPSLELPAQTSRFTTKSWRFRNAEARCVHMERLGVEEVLCDIESVAMSVTQIFTLNTNFTSSFSKNNSRTDSISERKSHVSMWKHNQETIDKSCASILSRRRVKR